jgi:ATP-dependent Clp protease protease subunit
MTEPIRLYGFVGSGLGEGDGFSAEYVAQELGARAKTGAKAVDVYLSSGGGSVVEGLAIHAQIQRFPGAVTVHVDGVAASIASIVAIAGSRLLMPPSAMLMIHRPWMASFAAGNSIQLREEAKRIEKIAADLDVMNDTMRGLYVAASGMSPAAVQKMMDDETWLTAEKAKALGFADEVPKQARAPAAALAQKRLLNLYRNTPANLRALERQAALARIDRTLTRQRAEAFARGASAALGRAVNSK